MSRMTCLAWRLFGVSTLLLPYLVQVAPARILFVPETYATINGAVAQSIADDTILVNRGTYPEQSWFPPHRISIMSHYELTGDTLDVTQTVIEGYSYADDDTATIALFLDGASDWSKLCGFTLQGGHGLGPGDFSGVFLADRCSPIICHNAITDNETFNSPVGSFYNCSGEFRGNHIFDNVFSQSALRVNWNLDWDPVLIEGNKFGANPRSPNAQWPGILTNEGGDAIIRGNIFRCLTGSTDLAISYHGRNPEITNNVFDSLTVSGWGSSIVWLYGTMDVVLNENAFSNIVSEDGVVMILHGLNAYEVTVEGNVFQDIYAPGFDGGPASAGLWIDAYHGVIRNNIFRSNTASTGGAIVLIAGGGPMLHGMVLEYNLIEACTTFSSDLSTGCIVRGAYRREIEAHHNLFRMNAPRVVSVDDIRPDYIADFRDNYWGHPSGPYHPLLNPEGLGTRWGTAYCLIRG